MKTPQEQAEEIANKTAKAMWTIGDGNKSDYEKDAAWYLLKSTALPELIAVAQVANRVITAKSIRNQMQAEFEMLKALDALRATRKVEL